MKVCASNLKKKHPRGILSFVRQRKKELRTGGQIEHQVRTCRRRNRKEEKLACRLKHFIHADWNQRRVAKMANILRLKFMSSEVSEMEETLKVKRYNVRHFDWESRELRRLKRQLNQITSFLACVNGL